MYSFSAVEMRQLLYGKKEWNKGKRESLGKLGSGTFGREPSSSDNFLLWAKGNDIQAVPDHMAFPWQQYEGLLLASSSIY